MVVYLGSVKNHTSFHRKRSSMSRWVDEVRKHCLQICRAFLAHCEGFRLSRVNQTELQPAMDCSEAMTRVANNAEHGLWDPTDEAHFSFGNSQKLLPPKVTWCSRISAIWMHQIAINIPIIKYHQISSPGCQFYYDVLANPDGTRVPSLVSDAGHRWWLPLCFTLQEPIKLRSIVGLIPLFAVEVGCPTSRAKLQKFAVHSSGLTQYLLAVCWWCWWCWLLKNIFKLSILVQLQHCVTLCTASGFGTRRCAQFTSCPHPASPCHAKVELPWGHAEEIAPFCRTNAWEPEPNQCRKFGMPCFNLFQDPEILQKQMFNAFQCYIPWRIHGAARKMVCHGSHQYTPFMLAYIPAQMLAFFYQHHGSVMGICWCSTSVDPWISLDLVAPSGSGCSTTAQIWHLWSPDLKRRSMWSGSFTILVICPKKNCWGASWCIHSGFCCLSWCISWIFMGVCSPMSHFFTTASPVGENADYCPFFGATGASNFSADEKHWHLKESEQEWVSVFLWELQKWCRLDLPSGNLT